MVLEKSNEFDLFEIMQIHSKYIGHTSIKKNNNGIMKNAISLMKDTKRLEMAKRIDELLDETDSMMKLQKKISLSVFAGIVSSLEPDESHELIAEFEAEFAGMEAMMRAETQQLIFASFIYTYQDINDSDMEKYELFLKSEIYGTYTI